MDDAGIAPGHRWCWLIRLPGCSMNRRLGDLSGQEPTRGPHVDGVQSTGFSHTVEFSRSLVGMLLATPLWFPIRSRRRSGGHRISGLPGSSTSDLSPPVSRGPTAALSRFPLGAAPEAPAPSRAASDPTVGRPPVFPGVPIPNATCFRLVPPPCVTSLRGRSASSESGPYPSSLPGAVGATSPSALHDRRAAPRPLLLGVRTATGSRRIKILVALGDLLSFRADAELAPPERSRSSKNVPT
jgi:hypothetical protein